jgi:prepilin-type N-terminal cleavage/methylation domain-containing protein
MKYLMSRNRLARLAFTLIELLVVVAIIAILLSVLLPTMSRARAQAKRLKCLANLRAIGEGYHNYAANDFPKNMFPGSTALGKWGFRVAPGNKYPLDDAHALPETYGLAALFGQTNSLSGKSKVWVCPSASEEMTSYGVTYAFSLAGVLEEKSVDGLKNYSDQPLVWDNFTIKPGASGWNGPFTPSNAWTIQDKDKFYPHRKVGPTTAPAADTNCYLYFDCHAEPLYEHKR